MSAFEITDAVLRDAALERLRRLVELESPSDDEVRLRAVAGDFAAELTAAGADVETHDVPGVGEHVMGRVAGAKPALEPVMILGHLDTVQPVGAFDPVFRTDDGRAYGPGTFDMKGGWACMLEALSRLHEAGYRPHRPVLVLATCDEETGSEHSRDLIEELARGVEAVLVPEPALPGGEAKTRRKGVGWYRLEVEGRASHAGLAPQDGVNAVVELAHQILALERLADPEAGTTVSSCLASGGTASNVIPASAQVEVDVRFTSRGEAKRVDRAIRSLQPVFRRARLVVSGGINRPAMERTKGVAALYERARSLAAESGWELGEGISGGASDGSLTAGLGIATLDGIGPRGGGAHAENEHVVVEDLGRRVRLYGRLLETL